MDFVKDTSYPDIQSRLKSGWLLQRESYCRDSRLDSWLLYSFWWVDRWFHRWSSCPSSKPLAVLLLWWWVLDSCVVYSTPVRISVTLLEGCLSLLVLSSRVVSSQIELLASWLLEIMSWVYGMSISSSQTHDAAGIQWRIPCFCSLCNLYKQSSTSFIQ